MLVCEIKREEGDMSRGTASGQPAQLVLQRSRTACRSQAETDPGPGMCNLPSSALLDHRIHLTC